MTRVAGLLALALGATACRTELNLERGRRYQCERDAGAADGGAQCTPGFRCGLDGYCFRVDAGEPRACEGPLDCAPDWRCGLPSNGVGACQAIGVAQPYPCTDDSWCEGGWRCGPAGVCLDVADDALLPPSGRATSVERLSPAPLGPIGGLGTGELAAGGWQAITLGPSHATLFNAGLRELTTQRIPLDGGLFAVRARDPNDGALLAIADAQGRTHLGTVSGDGAWSPLRSIAFPGFVPTGVAVLFGVARPNDVLVAWSPTAFAAWNLSTNAAEPLPAPPGVIASLDSSLSARGHLVAATSLGLFEFTAPAWARLPSADPGKCPVTPTRARVLDSRLAPISIAALFPSPDGGACAVLYGAVDGGLDVVTSARVCTGPGVASGVRPIDGAAAGVWVRCQAADGEATEEAVCPRQPCPSTRPSSPPPRERARAQAADFDLAIDELDFPVQQRGPAVERPLFGSSVIAGSLAWDSLISVTRGASGLEVAARSPTGDAGVFTLVPSLGFGRAVGAIVADELLPLAHVGGSPGWRVLANGEVRAPGEVTPLARFTPIRPLEGDVTAVTRAEPDGGFLYVSSFDALFTGPLTAATPMALRLVPASRSAITSVAAAPGPISLPDGGVVQRWGYLVAQGRLFRFESRSRVWRSDEVELPELAVSVWFDGPRPRVGTSTGRVFGLPTRVPLSEPLASGSAITFVSVCGQAFTASGAGVFVLDAPDAGLAAWRLHPELSAALPRRRGAGAPGDGLRLFALEPELVAVNADGVVARVTFDCDGGVP